MYLGTFDMLLNQWGPVNSWYSDEPVRATILLNGYFSQIQDAQLGSGVKPLVLDNGVVKVRATSEGVPLVYDYETGYLRTIAAGETLLI